MMRTVEQYAKCDPYAIITGSHAQVLYFMKDAKADIAELAAENKRLREALETVYLSFHGSNPSDAMADMSREDYLAYTLRSARLYAKETLEAKP